jgi:hypothetical protein
MGLPAFCESITMFLFLLLFSLVLSLVQQVLHDTLLGAVWKLESPSTLEIPRRKLHLPTVMILFHMPQVDMASYGYYSNGTAPSSDKVLASCFLGLEIKAHLILTCTSDCRAFQHFHKLEGVILSVCFLLLLHVLLSLVLHPVAAFCQQVEPLPWLTSLHH